jgi:hypothetical protein
MVGSVEYLTKLLTLGGPDSVRAIERSGIKYGIASAQGLLSNALAQHQVIQQGGLT